MNNPEEKIQEFYDNWKKKHGSTKDIFGHNIYYIETVDREGNTTGEAFGLNILTNYFFYQLIGWSRPIYDSLRGVYIGNGLTEHTVLSPDDVAIISTPWNQKAIEVDNNATMDSYRYMSWDNDNQVLICTRYLLKCYFDYVLGSISESFEVNEIGISCGESGAGGYGPQSNQLLGLHAAVYDANGDFGGIYKNPNERMYISVYTVVAMKPQLIHDALYSATYNPNVNPQTCFAMDPWAYNARRGTDETDGQSVMSRYQFSYIAYPRRNPDESEKINNYRGTYFCLGTASFGRGSYSGTMLSMAQHTKNLTTVTYGHVFTPSRISQLVEDKNSYVDMAVLAGDTTQRYSDYLRYSEYCAIACPVQLDRDEAFENVLIYTNGINDDTLTTMYGVNPSKSVIMQAGTLPIVDFQVTGFKAYNGLTKEWDIDMINDVNNASNNYLLSRHYLYPWVLVRMDTGIAGVGKQPICIWFNHWTDKPISSLDRNVRMFATDSWWDPSTWSEIVDYTNIPTAQGSKRYFLTIGGWRYIGMSYGDPSPQHGASTEPPIVVGRSGETIPAVNYAANVVKTNMDPIAFNLSNTRSTFVNSIAATDWCRHDLTCESRGYIWMSNTIYYPAEDVSYPIQTSDPIGTFNQPSYCARFTEPTGQRILQIFRGDTLIQDYNKTNDYYFFMSPRLSKISVFDVPDHLNCDDGNGNWTGTEYLIDMPADYVDTYKANSDYTPRVDITSTETGYVVFCHRTAKRADVINLLGTPGVTQLLHPVTGDPLETAQCFAIKYTNYVVTQDTSFTSDTEWKYLIIDLTDGSLYQECLIPKNGNNQIYYIRGWKNYLYFVYYNSASDMPIGIYDMSLQEANRFRMLSTNLNFAVSLIPGGSFLTHDWSVWTSWCRMMASHTFGDEHCFFVYRNSYTYNSGDAIFPLYYVDEDHPSEPLDINSIYKYNALTSSYYRYVRTSGSGTSSQFRYHGLSIEVGTFNQGKQRLLMASMMGSGYYNEPYILFYDLNQIRDTRAAITLTNDGNLRTNLFGNSTDADTSGCGRFYACMYDGKVYQFEYDGTLENRCNQATITISDPNKFVRHQISGTTRTIQCYNDPKKIYGINSAEIEWINNLSVWGPQDVT